MKIGPPRKRHWNAHRIANKEFVCGEPMIEITVSIVRVNLETSPSDPTEFARKQRPDVWEYVRSELRFP
jgi:hypothetical protein